MPGYTTNLKLTKYAASERNWDVGTNSNLDQLDGSVVGGLAVSPHEIPSASLNIKVSAGSFTASNGLTVAYAGIASQAVGASVTTSVWLSDAGVLTSGTSGFPVNTAIVPLAVVVSSGSAITSITDARLMCRSAGLSQLKVHAATNGGEGRAVLVAGAATVANTLVSAGSDILLTSQVDGGTPGWLRVSGRTPGVSFTITSSSNTDTSTVAWLLVDPS